MDSGKNLNRARNGKDLDGEMFYANLTKDFDTEPSTAFHDAFSRADLSFSGELKDRETNKVRPKKEPQNKHTALTGCGRVGDWFQTICLIRIPVIGWIYMFVVAIRKKTPAYKRTFAIAYIIFRLLVLLLAIAVLVVLYRVGVHFVDGILQYVE